MSLGKPEPHNLLAGLLKAELREPDQELDGLAHEVIGAAIEVHRQQLGPGLLESVYEAALCIELTLRGIPFVRQPTIAVRYKGRSVKVA